MWLAAWRVLSGKAENVAWGMCTAIVRLNVPPCVRVKHCCRMYCILLVIVLDTHER